MGTQLPPNFPDEMPDPLPPAVRVRRAARQADEAIRRRDQAIREMRAEGASLREIAEAAGLTHTGVRKILDRPEPQDPPEA